MPRKRRTKLTQRNQPKQPDSDSPNTLSEEDQNARVESFLTDFDIEVEKRVNAMRSLLKTMRSTIHQAFNLEILRLPGHIRDMKRSEIFGEKEADEIKNEVSSSVDQLLAEQLKTVPVKEEPLQNGPMTKSKKGRTRKKATTAKRTKRTTATQRKQTIQDENEPPATVARTTRQSTRKTRASLRKKHLETPANSLNLSQLGYDTPFMTPKFDPRLPVTPAMARQPKRGEVLMSFAGSPVINEGEINGSGGGKKVSQLPKEASILTNLQKLDEGRMLEELEEAALDDNSRKVVLSKLHVIMERILKNTADG